MSVREDYQRQMEAKMKEWGLKLEELKARAEGAQAEAKIKMKEEITALTEKQKAVQKKLHQLKEAGEDAWEDMKTGVENAWDDIARALNAAKSKIGS